MANLYYVGFNGYQQCPNDGTAMLPRVIHEWREFSLKIEDEVECTFRNTVIKTKENFVIYGLANEGNDLNQRTINFPVSPTDFLATDDYLFVYQTNNIWKSQYDDNWSMINSSLMKNEFWNNLEIIKLCYVHNKPHIVILLSDGSVWQLYGDERLSVVLNPALDKAVDITSGFEHVMILTENGCVLTHGNGSHGQLGHGDLDSLAEPEQVLALGGLKVVKIAAAGWHSCAITDSGDLYMWGWNNFGQLTKIREDCTGEESDKYEVTPLPVLIDFNVNKEVYVTDVACGVRHTVVVTEDNEIYSTGWNEYGQLGVNDQGLNKVNRFLNIRLPAVTGRKNIKCGPWSTLVYIENEIQGNDQSP